MQLFFKYIISIDIIKYIDFMEDDGNTYLILEYLEGGELFDKIVTKSFYNEKDAKIIMTKILNAIKYCHDHKIIHRLL